MGDGIGRYLQIKLRWATALVVIFSSSIDARWRLRSFACHVQVGGGDWGYLQLMYRWAVAVALAKNFSKVASIAKNFSKVATFDERINHSKNFSKVANFDEKTNKESNFGKVIISDRDIEKYLSKQFSNLFSCYTQSFNKVYHRKGSLFIKNFKREPISDKIYFLNAIVYTHRNPIHHGFRKKYQDWEYSSYNDIVDGVCDFIEISKLLAMTNGLESFKEIHRHSLENFTIDCDL